MLGRYSRASKIIYKSKIWNLFIKFNITFRQLVFTFNKDPWNPTCTVEIHFNYLGSHWIADSSEVKF